MLDPCEAGPVFVGGEFVGSGCGPFHEVGHAHAVVGEGMTRFAVDGGDAGGERGRPEAVAGASEPDERLSGVHAWVQPTDEQAHPRADDVGQGEGPASGDVDDIDLVICPDRERFDVEARTLDHRAEEVGSPAGETATAYRVSFERGEILITAEELEFDRPADLDDSVQFGEGHR